MDMEKLREKLASWRAQSARDRFESWMQDYLRRRYPELEAPLRAAIHAFDTIQETKCVTPELLAAIVGAASSSRRPLYESATTLVSELTGQFPEAQEAIVTMARNPHSHVRFNAILCIGKSTPEPVSIQLLRESLRDNSAKVRGKAADWIGRMRLRELISDLEDASQREKNVNAKKTIDFELRLLRDGHILERTSDEGFNVITHTKIGCASRFVSESELNRRGIDVIVAELAKE
jgi:hypothetical protein